MKYNEIQLSDFSEPMGWRSWVVSWVVAVLFVVIQIESTPDASGIFSCMNFRGQTISCDILFSMEQLDMWNSTRTMQSQKPWCHWGTGDLDDWHVGSSKAPKPPRHVDLLLIIRLPPSLDDWGKKEHRTSCFTIDNGTMWMLIMLYHHFKGHAFVWKNTRVMALVINGRVTPVPRVIHQNWIQL